MQSETEPPVQPPLPRLVYTIREACLVSTFGRATLFKHINAGRLSVVRIDGRTLIPVESLHKLLRGEENDGEE